MDMGGLGEAGHRQIETACARLSGDEFLEEKGVLRKQARLLAGQERQKLVAQRQEARWLQPDHRHARADLRQERIQRAPRLGARLVDHACRKVGAATAERATGGRRGHHLVACADQHAQGGAGDLGLHPAVERVGKEDDPPRLARAMGAPDLCIPEEIPAKDRQGPGAREAKQALAKRGEDRNAVAQGDHPAQRHGGPGIARHLGDQPFAGAVAQFLPTLPEHLGFHPGHVHAGGTFALAGLAADAEAQRLGHFVGEQRVLSQPAREREAQRVGAAPRHVTLVTGHAVAGTHRATRQLAAGAVVVAHLDRALKSAARAGPLGPVVPGFQIVERIARWIAHQAAVIHFRGMDDLAGVEARGGVKGRLDLFKRL